MAKFQEKIKAQKLRRQGKSIKQIAKQLKVSKSSASLWCKNIVLTKEQIAILQERMANKSSYERRMKGARVQRERRLIEINTLKKEGAALIKHFSKNDFLIAGAGLYWGEGAKNGLARIVNSDPNVIWFAMKWFRDIFGVPKDNFTLRISINIIHKSRTNIIENYWSKFLNIPLTQFTKTCFIKAKSKKIYENFNDYYGVLTITIQKSGNLRHKILGLIEKISSEPFNADVA